MDTMENKNSLLDKYGCIFGIVGLLSIGACIIAHKEKMWIIGVIASIILTFQISYYILAFSKEFLKLSKPKYILLMLLIIIGAVATSTHTVLNPEMAGISILFTAVIVFFIYMLTSLILILFEDVSIVVFLIRTVLLISVVSFFYALENNIFDHRVSELILLVIVGLYVLISVFFGIKYFYLKNSKPNFQLGKKLTITENFWLPGLWVFVMIILVLGFKTLLKFIPIDNDIVAEIMGLLSLILSVTIIQILYKNKSRRGNIKSKR